MKSTVFLILFGITLFFCPRSYGQNFDLATYKSHFSKELKGWTKTFTGFTLSSFKKEEFTPFEDIHYMDMKDTMKFYQVYKPALTFSMDKNQFIDIYSYWLALGKEGKRIVYRGGEPDQAVTLCNFKEKKWTRIFFRGTTERIQEVSWATNSKFILVGVRENALGKQTAIIYIGDVIKRTFESFASKDDKNVQKRSGYDSPKLLRLRIKAL